MHQSSFLRPYDYVFDHLQEIVKHKGYTVTSANEVQGVIKAVRKINFFMKHIHLDIEVYKINDNTTGLKFMLNNDASLYDKPADVNQEEEEKLFDCIHKHFWFFDYFDLDF